MMLPILYPPFLRLFLLRSTIFFATILFITPTECEISDTTWNTAVRKGTVLYEQMQSGCFPEKKDPISVTSLLASRWVLNPPWPPTKKTLSVFTPIVVQGFGWSRREDYYCMEAFRKRDKNIPGHITTDFEQAYSPQNGLIGVYGTWKGPQESIFWSDVTFALWQGITTLEGSNVKDIRYIARSLIYNVVTTSIMNSIAPEGSSEKVTVVRPGSDAFNALLGTPNGWGGVYLLMEHKRVLGFKTISRAVVIKDHSGKDPFLIFEVIDMPPPRSCPGDFSSNSSGLDTF